MSNIEITVRGFHDLKQVFPDLEAHTAMDFLQVISRTPSETTPGKEEIVYSREQRQLARILNIDLNAPDIMPGYSVSPSTEALAEINPHYAHQKQMREKERVLNPVHDGYYYIKFDGAWLIARWDDECRLWDGEEDSIDLEDLGGPVPTHEQLQGFNRDLEVVANRLLDMELDPVNEPEDRDNLLPRVAPLYQWQYDMENHPHWWFALCRINPLLVRHEITCRQWIDACLDNADPSLLSDYILTLMKGQNEAFDVFKERKEPTIRRR